MLGAPGWYPNWHSLFLSRNELNSEDLFHSPSSPRGSLCSQVSEMLIKVSIQTMAECCCIPKVLIWLPFACGLISLALWPQLWGAKTWILTAPRKVLKSNAWTVLMWHWSVSCYGNVPFLSCLEERNCRILVSVYVYEYIESLFFLNIDSVRIFCGVEAELGELDDSVRASCVKSLTNLYVSPSLSLSLWFSLFHLTIARSEGFSDFTSICQICMPICGRFVVGVIYSRHFKPTNSTESLP